MNTKFYEMSEDQIKKVFEDIATDFRSADFTPLNWFQAGVAAAEAAQKVKGEK